MLSVASFFRPILSEEMPAMASEEMPEYSLKELKSLGHQLLSSRAHVNNAPILISVLSSSSSPAHASEVIITLQSFFVPLLPTLPAFYSSSSSSSKSRSSSGREVEDAEETYRNWLRAKFDEFFDLLVELAVSESSDEAIKELALEAIMEFARLGKGGRFQTGLFSRLLLKIVHAKDSTDITISLLESKFLKYLDVCYFLYTDIHNICRSSETTKDRDSDNSDSAMRKIYSLLSCIPSLKEPGELSEHDLWTPSGIASTHSSSKLSAKALCMEGTSRVPGRPSEGNISSVILKKLKIRMHKAWLSFLRLPLPLDVYKKVLADLHQIVIPCLLNPLLLSDFLTRAYDTGGVVSVLALNSLFVLMTQHGLEYPNFYEKLYALLVPSVFMVRHRGKFFQLLDSCLKSPLLPAYLAASFAKRLSRLSLSATPSGSLIIIAIIHNLLRRHPSINFLVHQLVDEDNGRGVSIEAHESESNSEQPHLLTDYGSKPGIDVFKNEESDPMKTHAMGSSLWELDTLRHHYCSAVSRFILSLEKDLTDRAKTTEVAVKDFSSGSYGTIFKLEVGRRINQVPLAYYKATPASLFPESEFAGWRFAENDKQVEAPEDAEYRISKKQKL